MPPAVANEGGEVRRQSVLDDEIRTYRARWAMLALFSLASASNAILWITFSPINSVTQRFYDVSAEQVNTLSIVFLAAYVPVSVVSSWVFKRFGSRGGLALASFLNVLAGVVRFLSTESNDASRGTNAFAVLLAGQTLGAIAQPFFTNMPAKIGAVWFPAAERDLAVALASLSNPVGIAIGSVVPTLYVDNNTTVRMFDLLLMEMVVMAVSAVLVWAFFRERPPLPPSVSESIKTDMDLREQFRRLLGNRSFLILLACFGMGLGFFNALTTLLEQLVATAGYTTDDAGLFSGILLGCGLLSAIGVGVLMDWYHNYNRFLKIGFVVTGCAIVGLVFAVRPDNLAGLAVVFAVMGAAMVPMLPVAFECGVETTFPVSEDLSTGMLMSVGQITGIVFIVVLGKLLDEQPVYDHYVLEPAYIVILACTAFFVLGVQAYNGNYLRMKAEAASTSLAP